MPNRTGTYIAFDGLGETDPKKSDFKYYSTIQMWAENENIDFKYVDSHDKTAAVRDTSKRATLETKIRERLAASKNVVVILSSQTRKSGSMLSYEIEQAVDKYKLPLIITYIGYNVIAQSVNSRWPDTLTTKLTPTKGLPSFARSIHIPFKKQPLLAALSQYTPSKLPGGPLQVYTAASYVQWGLIDSEHCYKNIQCT